MDIDISEELIEERMNVDYMQILSFIEIEKPALAWQLVIKVVSGKFY
jgi:hypothetical protein